MGTVIFLFRKFGRQSITFVIDWWIMPPTIVIPANTHATPNPFSVVVQFLAFFSTLTSSAGASSAFDSGVGTGVGCTLFTTGSDCFASSFFTGFAFTSSTFFTSSCFTSAFGSPLITAYLPQPATIVNTKSPAIVLFILFSCFVYLKSHRRSVVLLLLSLNTSVLFLIVLPLRLSYLWLL